MNRPYLFGRMWTGMPLRSGFCTVTRLRPPRGSQPCGQDSRARVLQSNAWLPPTLQISDWALPVSATNLQRVFLVEDIDIIRANLTMALEEVSDAAVVGNAAEEDEAVAWLQANSSTWDIAVIDLFLKRGSGLGVLEACRRRQPTQRAVVLTNYATAAIRERCISSGADRVFDKSTELDAFLAYCAPL